MVSDAAFLPQTLSSRNEGLTSSTKSLITLLPPFGSYEEGKFFVLKQLWIKSFQEKDINATYNCTLLAAPPETKTFTLKKGTV